MSVPNLFDTHRPFESIVKFINRHSLLLKWQQKEFFRLADDYFTEKAYQDSSQSLPSEYIDRFQNYDIAALKEIYSSLEPENVSKFRNLKNSAKFRFWHLIANISKVAGINLNKVHQIIIPGEKSQEPVYWGWISAKYVKQSPKLMQMLRDGCIVLPSSVKPSQLLALNRYHAWDFQSSLELSKESLSELLDFAHEWDIVPILKNKEYLSSSLVKKETETPGNSPWFDESKPYECIVNFTKRGSALSHVDQFQFLNTLRLYFTRAFDDYTQEIPIPLEHIFSHISLPFLLTTMIHDKQERQRFLASIQIVAKRQFTHLGGFDRLSILENTYGPLQYPQRSKITWAESKKHTSAASEGSSSLLPLKILTVLEPSSIHTGTPKEVMDFLLFSLDQELPEWIQMGILEIQKRLKNWDKRKNMATELVKHFYREDLQKLIAPWFEEYSLTDWINIIDLNNDELYYLFVFYFNYIHPSDSASIVAKERKISSSELPAIMERLATSCATVKQRGRIQDYFLECISEKFSFGYSMRSFIKDFSLLNNQHRDLVNLQAAQKNFVESSSSYFLSNKDAAIRNLYKVLQKKEILPLFTHVMPEGKPEQLIVALLDVHPELFIDDIIDKFRDKFLPGESNDVLIKFIKTLLTKASLNNEKCWKDWDFSDLRKEYPLSDTQIVRAYEIIQSNEVSTWLQQNAPKVRYQEFIKDFDSTYLASKKFSLHKIEQALLEVDESHAPACELIRWINSHQGFIAWIHEKFADEKLTSQLPWIAAFLKKDTVAPYFKFLWGYQYISLLNTLERMMEAPSIVNGWLEGLVLGNNEAIFKEWFAVIYILGEEICSSSIAHIFDRHQIRYENRDLIIIQMHALLSRQDIKTRFSGLGKEHILQSAMQSLNIDLGSVPLPLLLEIHAYMEAVKGHLSQEAFDVLINALKIIATKGMHLPEYLERHIREKIDLDKLSPETISEIYRVLDTEIFAKFFADDTLRKAHAWLREYLTPKKNSTGGCSIS